jgi:predicted dehydrogenase
MNKVRFGIVGLGNMGSFHARSFKDIVDGTLSAVCDIDALKLEQISEEVGAKPFPTYQKMLDSGEIDAVLVAVPHYFHGEITRAAWAKGIHVLCEKPLCVSINEGRQVVETYKKYPNLKFGIMFQMRTTPMYVRLRDLITGGEIGNITRVTWIATDWFRTHAYYASGGWRATWDGEGGGVLINQCPHNLDQIGWITGLSPKRITAIANLGKYHPIETEDEVSAIIEFTNGAVGHFITTTGEYPGTNRLEIAGDRGRIVAEGGKLHFRRTRNSVSETNLTSKAAFATMETWDCEIPVPPPGGNEGHKVITNNFIRGILKDEPLISPGVEGVRGLELGNAMLMAGITGKPVDFPMDGPAYDALLKDLAKKYGGKKQVKGEAGVSTDMGASMRGHK